MRKEKVSFVRHQILNWYFFDAKNDASLTDVFLQNCPSLLKFVVSETSRSRWLHENADSLLSEYCDLSGGDGAASLPLVLAFANNSNGANTTRMFYHLLSLISVVNFRYGSNEQKSLENTIEVSVKPTERILYRVKAELATFLRR